MKAIIFATTAVLLLCACKENDISKVKELTTPEATEYDISEKPVITYSEKGYKRAVITAPVLYKWNKGDNRLEFPQGIIVDFYEKNQKVSTLTADSATNDELNKTTLIKGHVFMKNNKGETMEADEVLWDMRGKKIKADKWIKIHTKEEMLVGVGLDSDEDFKNYTIRKVKGIFSVNEDAGFRK